MIEYRIIDPHELVEFKRVRLSGLEKAPMTLLDWSSTGDEWNKPLAFHLDLMQRNIAMGVYDDGVLGGVSFATIYIPKAVSHKAVSWGTWIEPHLRTMDRVRTGNYARGTDLLAAVMKELVNRKIEICHASVVDENPGMTIQMHKSIGFQENYREKNGIKTSNGYRDVIFLIKYLTSTP